MRWLRLARATSDARLPQPYDCQLPGIAMNSTSRPEAAGQPFFLASRFRLVAVNRRNEQRGSFARESAACRVPKFLRTLEQDMRRKTEATFNASVIQNHLDFYPAFTRLASPQDVLTAAEID